MTWHLKTSLPECVVGVTYAENNHHITLINRLGEEVKLDATGLVKYACGKCSNVFYAASNHGSMKCPLCGGPMTTEWGKLQICFVPEKETEFGGCIK